MTTERLDEHRKLTLDIYRRLQEARHKVGKDIPGFIAKSQKNLEEQRFLLAIIGKVKAGKSTFINALLKDDLLPTDVLQATSAIIEIQHSEKPLLKVTYANGNKEEIEPGEGVNLIVPLTQKLRKVAAIELEERSLPVAQLNDFIIEQFNSDSGQAEWEPDMLESFIEVDLPRILDEKPGEWQQLSKDYLEKHRNGAAVAKKIEVGYPNKFNSHFRIVDTPGLCAKGGFAERTLEFLNNVDAVIYLHKDEPSDKFIHEALQNIIPEKVKKHMILVLTHKNNRKDKDNERFLTEAKRLCPQIPPERVFMVDSLTDRALQAFFNLKTWDEIVDFLKQDPEWMNVIGSAFMIANGDRPVLLDLLEKQSNMSEVGNAIRRFSDKSLGLQIETVLNGIVEMYDELKADSSALRDIYGEKLKDPQQFASEITRQQQEMYELQAESGKRVKKIKYNFDLLNSHTDYGNKLDSIINDFVAEVDGKEYQPEETTRNLFLFLKKIEQDVNDTFDEFVKEIDKAFRQSISEMEESLQENFIITVPKIVLTDILQSAREEAGEIKTRKKNKSGFWNTISRFLHIGGTENVEYKALSAQKYFTSAKSIFLRDLRSNKLNMAKNVETKINAACDFYRATMREKLDHRREKIQNIEREQQDNEDVRKNFEEQSYRVDTATREIAECCKIKGYL